MYTIVKSSMQHLTLNQLNITKQIFLNIFSTEKKTFACVGQLMVRTPIQTVKLPTTIITRLPSPFNENEFELVECGILAIKKYEAFTNQTIT